MILDGKMYAAAMRGILFIQSLAIQERPAAYCGGTISMYANPQHA